MKNALVSVIISTKNEADHLESCLNSLVRQSYGTCEIVVVDNHSSDDTKRIARRFTKRIFDRGPERSAQRNYGAAMSKGKYLLFIDADMTLTRNVISDCVEICGSRKFAGVVIPEKSIGIGYWARCKAVERACYERVTWLEAARFFRKDTFANLGGYDESLTGPEDFELPQRLKNKFGESSVGRIGSYILHDEGHLSLAKLLRKKYYYGREMRRYARDAGNRKYFQKQSNIFTRFGLFFRHPGLLLADPPVACGIFVMKVLEMAAITLGSVAGE